MKHLLLSASLLLFASNLTAQLHVSPNTTAGTDSYIYANDVVLYVEDEINLVVNNTVDTQASIYLRGDAQLIQGDKVASQNSGNGYLSVWQRGWANAFDYNYWASPVGVPAVGAGNTNFGISHIFDVGNDGFNNLEVTRSTPQTTVLGLNGIKSSVPDGDDGTLGVSRRWIYTMRAQSGYSNWIFIGQNPNLVVGEGFTMKGTGLPGQVGNAHDQLYDFRGRPNDGTITVPVAIIGGVNQETLTGNPYPSALDMREFLLNNPDIEATAFYWDQNRVTNSHYIEAYEGGYGVWQPNGGATHPTYGDLGLYTNPVYEMYDGSGIPLGTTGNFGDPIERRFAPIGQGFMVRGTTNGVATFTNDMRRHVGLNPAFSQFRNNGSGSSLTSSSGQVILPEEPVFMNTLLRFYVEVNDSYARDMVLVFSPETTKGKDRGWDSRHPSVISAGDAYWKLEGETDPYVIQTRPYDFHSKVPIGFRVKNGQNSFKVNLVEMKGFNNINNFKLFLYDELQNSYQKLDLSNQAMVNYSGDAGFIEDRYYLVFKRGHGNNGQNGNGNGNNKTLAAIDFFQNNPQAKLEVSNPGQLDIKEASVYDMRGRLVINEKNLGTVTRYSFSTQGLSSGVYLVKLNTAEHGVIDYKITVHNK